MVYSAELDFDTTNGAKTADAVESSAEAAGKQYEDPAESQQEAAESSAEAVTEPDAGAEENAIGQNAEAESDYGYAGEGAGGRGGGVYAVQLGGRQRNWTAQRKLDSTKGN